MKLFHIAAISVLIGLTAAGTAWGQVTQENLAAEIQAVENEYNFVHDGAEEITKNTFKEIDDRDRLLLQRRFVDGRDFYFLVQNYRGAAEIFYAIVTHPAAKNLPNLDSARYYLSESLFQTGYYRDAQREFQTLRSMGASTNYFGIALVRLIQMSILKGDFGTAENYYSELLSQMPKDYDGSLGMYIYGRALYLKGETSKASSILDGIPETGDYYSMAQYFLSVMDVKSKQYQRAINRLRQIRTKLNPDLPDYEAIKTQTELALGRLHYELDDYPRAISNYVSVSPAAPQYADAMYESLWVLLTRNDYLLLKIHEEQIDFDSTTRDYDDFASTFEVTKETPEVKPVKDEVRDLQGTMKEMRIMFTEIDKYLANLQQEAVNNYNNLAKNAPNSPIVPEADLLLANIHMQAADFDKARELFEATRNKYSDFYNRLTGQAGVFQDNREIMGLVGKGLADTPKYRDAGVPAQVPAGVPQEIAYWLAANPEVQNSFELYETALSKRRDLDEIQETINQIEAELRKLERDPSFPILKETHRRSLELIDRSRALQARINRALEVSGIEQGDAEKLKGYLPVLSQDALQLQGLESKLEQKKNETIAFYRQSYRELAAPVPSFRPDIETAYSQASDVAGRTARMELRKIQTRLQSYVGNANAGIVDTNYRKTEAAADKVKDIQKEMNEELLRFRLQYQKPGSTDAATEKPQEGSSGE